MTRKFPAASKLATLLAAAVLVVAGATAASAQTKQQRYDRDGRPYYGPSGPNRVYQQGPRTRVYVTTRSWLDAGTEVLPGDRKFQDYAFPPDLGYPSFARENLNRPTWAAIPSASRCTERERHLTKMPGLDRAFFVQPANAGS
jgi:hypothetical protein